MDPYYIYMLSNTKKCSSKISTNACIESYNEIIKLLNKIDNDDLMGNICKLALERYCSKQLTANQMDIIISSIKKIE